jgi:hypothetical protein
MAIYSLHHQPIGRSTQARPHTSAAHVRYITRPTAASRIEARRMPDKPHKAAAFMVEGENSDRKNARVSDKLLLALPRELDSEQRAQLVRGFAEEVTQGRAPWLAAFHDQGKDAHNPHAHLLIRDRDPESGKRVAGLSEKGSTERLRVLWEKHANGALEQAGRSERIDRRTLEAQGIQRAPTVHEGPRAQQMDARGAQPESRMRRYRNRLGSRLPYRYVDYRRIDGGRSRPAYNRQLDQRETQSDYWQAIDADRQGRELDQLRHIHHPPHSVNVALVGRSGRVSVKKGLLSPSMESIAGRVAPVQSSGLVVGPALLEPSPDRISRMPAQDAVSEPLGIFGKPSLTTLRKPVLKTEEPLGETLYHSDSMGSKQDRGKEKGMDFDERDRKLRADRLAEEKARAGQSKALFWNTMHMAYIDPDAAYEKQQAFRAKHGNDALNKEVADSKSLKFGRRPGSMLSKDYLSKDAKKARENSHMARRALPAIIDNYHRDQNNLAAAQRSYDEAHPRQEPQQATRSQRPPQPVKETVQQPQRSPARSAERRPETAESYKDKQNSDAMRQAREARQTAGPAAEKRSPPQSPEKTAPAQSHGHRPKTAESYKDRQNNEARRQMMDKLRDDRIKQQEREKAKGKGKGFEIGD